MQLLPGTARDVAGRSGVPFIQDKLTRDPAYNVQLGSQYLAEMLERFGGSYELALAAYNAGPNRVARWLETMGDPRAGKIDMVDWIEMIPFRETRNYVQRIMEGVGRLSRPAERPVPTVPPATGAAATRQRRQSRVDTILSHASRSPDTASAERRTRDARRQRWPRLRSHWSVAARLARGHVASGHLVVVGSFVFDAGESA